MNYNYRMNFTFTGTQNEIIEQMEILTDCLRGSIHSELVNFRMQEAVVAVIQNMPNEKTEFNRTITAQDNTCPKHPSEWRKE